MPRTMAEIQQVDAARPTWDGTNNRKETIFKPLNHNILRTTLKPSSHILVLKHILYYTTVDQFATNSRPIFHQQSTDILPTIDTTFNSQVTTGILAMYRLTCQLTHSRVSADTPFTISVECRPTYRSTYRPIQ